ncbi:MAG: TolC family protein [Thermodesulfobacteriota bacterium]
MQRKRFINFISVFLVFFLALLFMNSCAFAAEEQKVYNLKTVLSISIEKNPSLAVFKANLGASRGALIAAGAYPNPELELGGSRGKSLETGETKGEYSIGIGQPLEWPGKRLYRKKAARSAVEAVEMDLADLRLKIKAEVKTAFFRVLTDKKTLRIAEDNLHTVQELLKSVQIRVKAGEAPEFELVKARVEALRADKDMRKAGNVLFISKVALNALLGNTFSEDFDVMGDFSATRTEYALQRLLSYAMERHPVLLKARVETEAKGFSLKEQRASIVPDVTLSGFYDKELDKESVGVGLSMPIPLWYRRKGEISVARAELARAENEAKRTKVELAKAVTSQFSSYRIALDQLDVFDKGLLNEAQEALRIADISYRHGESGLLDYLDAQRVYRSVLMEYYQSLFELEASLASLERVVGGLP